MDHAAEKFITKMAAILEVDPKDINLSTDFRNDVPYWDSLMGFSALIMIEEEFGIRLSVTEFMACKTLGDLFDKVKSIEK